MSQKAGEMALFMAAMGVAVNMGLSSFGAAYALAHSGNGMFTVCVMKPNLIPKMMLTIIMAGMLSIYSLVSSIIQIKKFYEWTAGGLVDSFTGYILFSGGLLAGLCNLASGVGIGLVVAAGIRGVSLQARLYFTFILTLMFLEALGLFGFVLTFVINK